ncbi:MAG: hypothetical protein ACHQFX_13025, partial [Chitinophagales bacterium]
TGCFFELIILNVTGISWHRMFVTKTLNKRMKNDFVRNRVKKIFMEPLVIGVKYTQMRDGKGPEKVF